MVTDLSADTSHSTPGAWLTRPVAILVAARAVNHLGAFTLPFLAVLLIQRHHLSVASAGLVVALFGVTTVPSRLTGGFLTRRLGARGTMVLGLTCCAVAQVGIAIAPTLVAVLAAVALLGLAYEIYEPASQSMIADLTAPAHRSRAFSLFGAALALGGVLAGLLAALIGGLDLRWLFVADAASCLSCATVVRIALPDHRSSPPDATTPGKPWRDRRLLAMLGLGIGFATLYLLLQIALPLTLVARGEPGSRYGLVITVSSLVVVLAQPLLGTRRARRRLADPFTTMALGCAVLAVGLAATAFATSLPEFLLATVLWAAGDVLLLGPPFAVVADLAPPGGSAGYLAAYGTCWGVAGVLAPLIGTTVLTYAGPTILWSGCAVAALGLAAVQPVVRRRVT